MQGGYEPRGSRGPGRRTYLVRRAVFVLIAIVLFAFVLPRACGAFSDPDTTDSALRQSETESADGPSGGGGSSSGSAGSAPGDTSGAEDEPAEDESDEGSNEDDGENAMPSTVEEAIALEEPEAPSGIPTVALSEERARQAGGANHEDPARDRIEASEITLALRSNPPVVEPIPDGSGGGGDRVPETARPDSGTVPVEQPATTTTTVTGQVVAANTAVTSVVEPQARIVVRGGGRAARAGNNVAYAPGASPDAGGGAAATMADAGRSLDGIVRGRGGRTAVRGALRDAEIAVSIAESLDEASTGMNGRCARNPQRCLAGSGL